MRLLTQLAVFALATGALLPAPRPVYAGVPVAATAPVFAAPSVEDVALLIKAVDAVQKNPVTITSDLKVRASGNGVLLTINETIKVTGQFPGKFRADVTLLDEDGTTPAARFQVTGDGRNVTTYRPGTKQYAVQSVESFHKDFAMPAIGVVCGLIASGDPWGTDESPVDAVGVAAFTNALKQSGLVLESGAGDKGQRVFSMRPVTGDTNAYRVTMTADPVTGGFVAMEMSGKQGDWKVTVTETVRSMAKLPTLAIVPFSAPSDAVKVAKLSVWPF